MAVGVIIAVFLLPTVLLALWWVRGSKLRRLVNEIPGPPTVPLLGNAHQLKTGGADFFEQVMNLAKTYSTKTGVFRLWVGTHPVIVLTKAETAEVVLKNSKNITKSFIYDFLVPWLGTGLLTSTGAKWHSRRKMLTPTFHFRILEDFLHIFNEQSTIMVERLDSKVDSGRFEVTPYVTLCTLDIICGTAMGRNISAQSHNDSEYVKTIYRVSEIVLNRFKNPWQWPNFIFERLSVGEEHRKCIKSLHAFTDQVIKERRAETEQQRRADNSTATAVDDLQEPMKDNDDDVEQFGKKPRRRLAFLDLLLQTSLENSVALTDDDIREEVDTFMFEGHDTTSAAINWTIHLVGANPVVQKKLHEELDRVFGNSNRSVTMNDIKELKYLECVIKESLRLFPSVPFFGRRITDDFQVGDFHIPKGVTTFVMTAHVHRDPRYFPDPERFDPDRWLPENSVDQHPFAFVAFSAGPRNCIGQKFAMIEEKVLLTYIFRKFKVTSTQTREDLRPTGDLITRPEKGIFIEIDSRQTPASLQNDTSH